jgi:hypothetical protein
VFLGSIFRVSMLIPASLLTLATTCMLAASMQFSLGTATILAISSLVALQAGFVFSSICVCLWTNLGSAKSVASPEAARSVPIGAEHGREADRPLWVNLEAA